MRSGTLDASFVGAVPDPALQKSTTSYENQRQRKFSASGFWIFNKWPTVALPEDSHGQLFSSSSQYLHNTELPVLILILRSKWFSICWKQPIFIVCPFSRFPAIKPLPLLVLHLSPVPRQIPIHLYKVQTLSSLSRRERFSSVSSISGTIFQYASDSLSALYSSHTLTNAG